jgi:hypothetical protein
LRHSPKRLPSKTSSIAVGGKKYYAVLILFVGKFNEVCRVAKIAEVFKRVGDYDSIGHAPTGVITTPGTKNPKYVAKLTPSLLSRNERA